MSTRLIDITLNRAGWGNGQSFDLDVRQTEAARDPAVLPNLLRVEASEPLGEFLSWPRRSGCALQCQYALSPIGRDHPRTLMTAEAVKWSGSADLFEIELVNGWPGEPHFWGNRSVHEEEVEVAIHGMAPNSGLQLLSIPAERDTNDTPRARILQSRDDTAVLFIAGGIEEARVLAGVVERLCDTGALVQRTDEVYPLEGSSMAGTEYRRTGNDPPLVTRWLGGHGTRSQQAFEQRIGVPWPAPVRWSGVSP